MASTCPGQVHPRPSGPSRAGRLRGPKGTANAYKFVDAQGQVRKNQVTILRDEKSGRFESVKTPEEKQAASDAKTAAKAASAAKAAQWTPPSVVRENGKFRKITSAEKATAIAAHEAEQGQAVAAAK